MAIYLFVIISLSQLYAVTKILTNKTITERIGAVLGWGLILPPYIWFGWFSGLIF